MHARALGLDNRVARLNFELVRDWDSDCNNWTSFGLWGVDNNRLDQRRNFVWPEPYLLSKLVRHISFPIKRGWLATKKALSNLGHCIRKHFHRYPSSNHAGGKVESGETGGREELEASEDNSPQYSAEKAKVEFRKSLQNVFSEVNTVNGIMSYVDVWERGS